MKTLVACLLTIFLANMVFATFAQAAECPLEGSRAERDLLLTKGPSFMESGNADHCLRTVIDREMQSGGWSSEKELVSVLMDAAWKAESSEINLSNQ